MTTWNRCVAVALWLIATAAYAASPAETEARKLVEAGDYKQALTVIAKALNTTGGDADADDKYQLLMLRGEALLHTTPGTASNAYAAAADLATDVRLIAPARAMVLLIRASTQGKYRPRTVGAQPIDIVDPTSRKTA